MFLLLSQIWINIPVILTFFKEFSFFAWNLIIWRLVSGQYLFEIGVCSKLWFYPFLICLCILFKEPYVKLTFHYVNFWVFENILNEILEQKWEHFAVFLIVSLKFHQEQHYLNSQLFLCSDWRFDIEKSQRVQTFRIWSFMLRIDHWILIYQMKFWNLFGFYYSNTLINLSFDKMWNQSSLFSF